MLAVPRDQYRGEIEDGRLLEYSHSAYSYLWGSVVKHPRLTGPAQRFAFEVWRNVAKPTFNLEKTGSHEGVGQGKKTTAV